MLSRTAISAGPAKSGVSGLICKRRGSLEEHETGSCSSSPLFGNPKRYAFPRTGNAWPRLKAKEEDRIQPPGHISIFCGTFPRMGNGHTRSRSWTCPFSDPFEALRRSGRPQPPLPQRSQWFPSLHKGNPTSFTPPYPAYTFTFALSVLLSRYGRSSRNKISATMAKAAMEPMIVP